MSIPTAHASALLKENPCSYIDGKKSNMKTTLTPVRVDLGAVGGHLQPSELLVSSLRAFVEEKTKGAPGMVKS